jgi:hypothetical protein
MRTLLLLAATICSLILAGCESEQGCAGCEGCCIGDRCVAGTQWNTCGAAGAECVTCAYNQSCTNRKCVATCGPENCEDGCCAEGKCLPGNLDNACGDEGRGCINCLRFETQCSIPAEDSTDPRRCNPPGT